ncbi:MAG TPA: hemolysin family protein [Bellilinea sp.]
MDVRVLWIIIAIIFGLDLLTAAIRVSLGSARLTQLITYGAQNDQHSLEPTMAIMEKVSLRVALRFLIIVWHVLLAALVYQLLMTSIPGISIGVALLVVFLTALLVMAFEFGVEGGVRKNPEAWLVRLTPLARGINFILRPFTAMYLALLGDSAPVERTPGSVTDDELKTWVEVGESAGGLEKGERQMIYSIFHFGDTLCREIMVPRIDILALEADSGVTESIQALTLSGHSRVPVYDDTIDNVVGLLYAKDLLRTQLDETPPESIRPFLRPAYFVPESKKVDELLREMQARSIHMAIVVDEYGGMAGLVTMEDIVEEIVGEIRDEYDQGEEYLYQRVSDDEFLLNGRIGLDDFNEILGTDLVTELADTLGGYIYGTIGRVPTGGEHMRVEDWDLMVEQVSGRRIRKVRAHRQPLLVKEDNSNEPNS